MKVQNIGALLKTDSGGFLVNESAEKKINSPWREAVGEIRDTYIKHLGERLHSLYVRGTVARGEAVKGISDIDTISVVSVNPENLDLSWVQIAKKDLASLYPFATGFEFQFVPHDSLLESEEYQATRFVLKTQCACIYGPDLTKTIERFKADRNLAEKLIGDVAAVVRKSKRRLQKAQTEADIQSITRWIMKRLLRRGFVLAMTKEKAYTRDLYPCYEVFARHFPKQEKKMRQALEWAINPPVNKSEVLGFIDDFGEWLASEAERNFPQRGV